MNNSKWKMVIQILISILTALGTTLGTTSCMGHGPIFLRLFFYSLVTGYAYIQTRLQPHVNTLRKISLRKISHNIWKCQTFIVSLQKKGAI